MWFYREKEKNLDLVGVLLYLTCRKIENLIWSLSVPWASFYAQGASKDLESKRKKYRFFVFSYKFIICGDISEYMLI